MDVPIESEHSQSSSKLPKKKLRTKTRRSLSRRNKVNESLVNKRNLVMLGTNSNGLNTKKESLLYLVNTIKPSAITIQETKFSHEGTFKIPGFKTFEHIRSVKGGGGLFTAVLEDLNPLEVSAFEDIELLVVQCEVGNLKIRIMNAYGPQEDDEAKTINQFWQAVETEVIIAKQEECLIVLQLDANAKIGKELLPNDPNSRSKNGQILLNMVHRQGLHIGNLSSKCEDTITRERVVNNKTEQSVIDYFIYCDQMANFFDQMVVDDRREMVLKRTIKRRGLEATKSDHNILMSKFSVNYTIKKPKIRKEYFNFKRNEDKLKFFSDTNTTMDLTSCFVSSNDFDKSSKSFFKELNRKFH